MNEPEEFKAKMVDGKLQIQCRTEEVPNKNGGTDVIIHAPSLSVIKDTVKKIQRKEDQFQIVIKNDCSE